MSKIFTTRRITSAIEAGSIARCAYYARIDLPNEQVLGSPATPGTLESLEEFLKRKLPPSYRIFLSLCDGWRMIDGGVDLLSIENLMGPTHMQAEEAWKRSMTIRGDEWVKHCLVISHSEITATRYLLDPEQVDALGEWRFMQFHNGIEAQRDSFGLWLEESVDEYNELAVGNFADE